MKKKSRKSYVISSERIPSGIPGLDKLIEGGLLKGSTTLVSGGTGTGKTIFCAQFLMEGLRRGEKCFFITLEERPEDIVADVQRFGWDFSKYISEQRLFLDFEDPFRVTDITSPLLDKIQEHKISRVVVDSTSVLSLYFKEPSEIRKQLFKLLLGLKGTGVTTMITTEVIDENRLSRFGVEEFLTDAVILLHYLGIGESVYNSLQVRKMRRTKHEKDVFPFEFSKNGIVVKKS